jgi:hypothetical protein
VAVARAGNAAVINISTAAVVIFSKWGMFIRRLRVRWPKPCQSV